jgi:hypothetical protein
MLSWWIDKYKLILKFFLNEKIDTFGYFHRSELKIANISSLKLTIPLHCLFISI